MEELGGWALALPSDAVDADAAERAASEVEKKFGPIEVWVINAMTTILVPFWEITPAEYKRATEVTYLAFVYGTMAALKRMRQRDRGRSCYASAEPTCLLRSQARDLRASRIRSARSSSTIKPNVPICVVHLPAMNTPQFSRCRSSCPNSRSPSRRSTSPRLLPA